MLDHPLYRVVISLYILCELGEKIMTSPDWASAPVDKLAPHFDLYDPAHGDRLWEVLDFARSHCPVLRTDAVPGYFIVTRYDDVRAVAEDPVTFSSAEPGLLGTPIRMPPVTEDPPTHADYRRQLNPYFARTALAKFEADMRDEAARLVAAAAAPGRMEFMNDFAIPFTARNLARLILDETNEDRLDRAIAAVSRISSEGSAEAFVETASIAEQFLRDRAGTADDDGVLSAIVTATVEGRPLTMEEQVGVVVVLFLGGLDTTKATLGNMMRHLIEDPGLEARLRDSAWLSSSIDEFLRYETPVTFQARTVTRDTVLGGCPMKAGDRIALHFASANRDEKKFPEAASLVFGRERNPHAAFGLGVHRCIGLHFARMQIETAWEALLSQLTSFRVPPGEHIEMARGVVLTPERLPVTFDRRQTPELP
jgi:cytochrome P450